MANTILQQKAETWQGHNFQYYGTHVFNYWTHDASCPTGDKTRIGKKEYEEHIKHVLEKSLTEASIDFRTEYPDVHTKQRKFEALKLFFVQSANKRIKDHVFTENMWSALRNTVAPVFVPETVTDIHYVPSLREADTISWSACKDNAI